MKTKTNTKFAALVTRARWQGEHLPVLSVNDVAVKCDISRSYLWLMMAGRRSPGSELRPRLARVLRTSVKDIEECFPPAKR